MRAYACTAPALMRKGRDGTYSEGRVSPWIRHRAPEAEPIAIPSPGASLSIRSTQSLSPTPPDSTESTVAVDSSLEVGSASSSSVLVDANSLAAAQRVPESVSGGSKTASTPCSSAKAAPVGVGKPRPRCLVKSSGGCAGQGSARFQTLPHRNLGFDPPSGAVRRRVAELAPYSKH